MMCSVLCWIYLCYRKRSFEIHIFCITLLAGTPFGIFVQNILIGSAELYHVVMTHHTIKDNLEKASSWPLEAIPYRVQLRVDY